ncbi:hypothetical protein ACFQ14_12740 [Pseudahrensia aquimaris]|uniref:Uncharacterized protein n=1 Tax=Pseudahrensia aquimaris TaxID=744461 RepID=A0ABW3FHN8_9HYPH
MTKKSDFDPLTRHRDFISALAKTPLSIDGKSLTSDFFQRPKDCYRSMPSHWKSENSRIGQSKNLSNERSDFVEILRRGLGHIAANPSVQANVRAMKLSYKFPESVEIEEFADLGIGSEIRIVNENEAIARHFMVEDLGNAAKQAAEDYRLRLEGAGDIDTSTDAIFRKDKYLIIGDRGVGKTFFLNYLISQHTQELHEKGVIIVRLDLTKDVDDELGIAEWLHWKICKILFTYYDEGAFDRDAIHDVNDPAIQHFLDKSNLGLLFDLSSRNDVLFEIARTIDVELSRTEFSEEFRRNAAMFRSPVDTTPRKISTEWFFPMIWDYMIKVKECSFITIFDGLDQLGLTNSDRDRYNRLIASINGYLGSEKSLYTATLVTMRPKSWIDRIGDDNFRRVFQGAVIAAPDNRKILEQKEEYLTKPNFFRHKHQTVGVLGDQYSDSIRKFANVFVEFITMSLTRSVAPNLPEVSGSDRSAEIGFNVLEQIFGSNKRKTFQALSDLSRFFVSVLSSDFERMLHETVNVVEFFEHYKPGDGIMIDVDNPYSEVMRYNYLVIEALLLESPKEYFRQEKYGYDIDSEGKIVSAAKSDSSISHYLHNIFHYVSNPTKIESSHVFAGIRILQISMIHSTIDKNTLLDLVCTIFNYKRDIVEQKFNEMCEDGLFQHKLDAPHVVVDSFSITFAGKYAVSRLASSLEYICMTLQTVPLPKSLVSAGYFPVRPHSSAEFVVYNKVFSALNFARYCELVESEEQKLFEDFRLHGDAESLAHIENRSFDEIFSISEKITSAVLKSIDRIVDHAHESELTVQLSQLDTLIASGARDLAVGQHLRKTA